MLPSITWINKNCQPQLFINFICFGKHHLSAEYAINGYQRSIFKNSLKWIPNLMLAQFD